MSTGHCSFSNFINGKKCRKEVQGLVLENKDYKPSPFLINLTKVFQLRVVIAVG